MTDDVAWEIPGPPQMHAAGRRFGREQVARFFEILGETTETQTFEPREFLAQGDKVVAIGQTSARAKGTGREYVTDFAMIFTTHDGKAAEFREYPDTGAAAAAFDTRQDRPAVAPATPGGNQPMAGRIPPRTGTPKAGRT